MFDFRHTSQQIWCYGGHGFISKITARKYVDHIAAFYPGHIYNTSGPFELQVSNKMFSHLSGVRTKMQQNGEHCVLLALPCGKDPSDVEAQSRQLREHFITYLQLKGAAGI